MVNEDESGKKYEFQYCVVVSGGGDKGLKHYVWASKEQIQSVFDMPAINKEIPENITYIGHISGYKGDKVHFNKKNWQFRNPCRNKRIS